eukprot:NODE_13482_length_1163_cov_4.225869.p10 GENE.NODE_13482_length_1163_cov_4.225869~~NODE_13482_length_1163_cov_4.225869.p10  ORF type:complete len:54 (-),score=6.34 NODE_13482_length_1163_cov_4.225869:747-908(-)
MRHLVCRVAMATPCTGCSHFTSRANMASLAVGHFTGSRCAGAAAMGYVEKGGT